MLWQKNSITTRKKLPDRNRCWVGFHQLQKLPSELSTFSPSTDKITKCLAVRKAILYKLSEKSFLTHCSPPSLNVPWNNLLHTWNLNGDMLHNMVWLSQWPTVRAKWTRKNLRGMLRDWRRRFSEKRTLHFGIYFQQKIPPVSGISREYFHRVSWRNHSKPALIPLESES